MTYLTADQEPVQKHEKERERTAIYVYGVVPADVEVQRNAKGVGDPPAKVDVIREGDIAALVSTVRYDDPLGRPEDLQAHAQLLDGTARVAPVLPLRFGAVMTDAESVADELLRDHHDEFAQRSRVSGRSRGIHHQGSLSTRRSSSPRLLSEKQRGATASRRHPETSRRMHRVIRGWRSAN